MLIAHKVFSCSMAPRWSETADLKKFFDWIKQQCDISVQLIDLAVFFNQSFESDLVIEDDKAI